MSLEFNVGQQGPTKVTGNCDTRDELEKSIVQAVESGLSQNKTAARYMVACSTVNNIMKEHRKQQIEKQNDLRHRIMRRAWV